MREDKKIWNHRDTEARSGKSFESLGVEEMWRHNNGTLWKASLPSESFRCLAAATVLVCFPGDSHRSGRLPFDYLAGVRCADGHRRPGLFLSGKPLEQHELGGWARSGHCRHESE